MYNNDLGIMAVVAYRYQFREKMSAFLTIGISSTGM
jgi:hypothetical protein